MTIFYEGSSQENGRQCRKYTLTINQYFFEKEVAFPDSHYHDYRDIIIHARETVKESSELVNCKF